MPGNETAECDLYTHAIHIHNSQLASSLSSSTVCGVVLECGCEYYSSSVDAAGGRGSVEKINSRRKKKAFFGHARRNNKCNLAKTCILGMMSGKRRRGRPRMQYIDNIKKWTRASLEENVRLSEDRSAWRERSCAAGAANVRTDDAD